MFGGLEEDSEDANVDIKDKEGRREEEVRMPPGLEESDEEVEEMVDSDSEDEDVEMKEWLEKLGMRKTAGGEVVIVRREMKEAEVQMEKKVVKSSVGEARRGMKEDLSLIHI